LRYRCTPLFIPPLLLYSLPLKMTPPDLEVLSAGITALGGQWRTGLTRDVTHLFALGPGSDKYETAMHFQADTHMKVVLPHWFDDAVKLGVGGLPTAGYEWPEPRYLRADFGEDEVGGGGDGGGDGKKGSARKSQLSGEKKRLFQSVGWTDAPALPSSSAAATAKKDVWVGRKILLSVSLELSGGRREAVEAGIKRAGGVVVVYKKGGGDGDLEEELRKIGSADVFITRYRHGAAYLKVCHIFFRSFSRPLVGYLY
jgi:mediator of DNA damage checkpoint protein 1